MTALLLAWAAAVSGHAQVTATDDSVLCGLVVDALGRPQAGLQVIAELGGDDPARIPSKPPARRELREIAATDARGRFVFLNLRAGTYRLSVASGLPAGTASALPARSAQMAFYIVSAGSVSVSGEPVYVVLANRADRRVPGMRIEGLSTVDFLNAVAAGHDGVPGSEDAPALAGSVEFAESSPGDRADSPEEDQEQASVTSAAPRVLAGGDDPAAPQAGELTPGVAGVVSQAGGAATTLDGLSAAQVFRSGGRGGARGSAAGGSVFAQGSVRSVRGTAGSFSATAGNGPVDGGELSSRSGAGGLHGGGFATLRLSGFDAANPYAVATHYRDGVITSGVVKPGDTDVQAGAHVGFAPLAGWRRAGAWRERVFGFAALEGRVREAPVESTPALPSFYALTPTQRALLGTRGVSLAQVNSALDYLDGLSGEIPRSETRLLSFGRLDVKAGARDAVAVTFAGSHLRSPAGAEFDQLADAVVASGRGSVGDNFVDVNAFAAHWAHAFSPRLENALRAQIVHDLQRELPRAPLAQEPAISPGGEAPEVEIAPEGFTYGTAANLDRTAYPDEHRVELADTLRWVPALLRGRHVLTLGGDWSRAEDRVDSLRNVNGTFLYDSDDLSGRAGGLVDWITDATFNVQAYPNGGCPSITAAVHDFCFRTYTQSFGNAEQQFTTNEFSGFAEDSFAVRPDLRITLGVRYEYTLLPLPQVPNAGLDASLRSLAASGALPGSLAGVTSAFPEDRNNAGPRVGVAWAPGRSRNGGRWATIRAGYGWFYGRLPGTTLRAALADNDLPSGISQVRITPATETTCPQVANQGFGYPCAFSGQPPSAVAQTGTAMLFAGRFRLSAIQRATLSVERALGTRIEVELGYAGAVAVQLPTSTDVNIAPATSMLHLALQGGLGAPGLAGGRTFDVPLYTARRLAAYGPVTAVTSQANATYHAGTLRVRMREWHGAAARGSLTFSRAIDDDPQTGTGSGPRVNGSFDPFAIGYDKGLSDTQAALRFAGAVTARSDVRRGSRAVRASLSGWRVTASATASSGAPYSYEIFGGTRLSGGYESINGSGGETFLPTVGRNTLRLPARANVDMRLERGGTLHGVRLQGVRLSGFVQAFNLPNERNLSRVETRAFLPGTPAEGIMPLVFQDAAAVASEGVTTPAFGTATSSTGFAGRERLVALGARVEF